MLSGPELDELESLLHSIVWLSAILNFFYQNFEWLTFQLGLTLSKN